MPRKKKNIVEKTFETGKKGGAAVAEKLEDMTHTKQKRGRKKSSRG